MTNRSVIVAGMVVLFSSVGCLGEAPGEDEHQVSGHEIRNGTETLAFGVVRIHFTAGRSCTGAMINQSYIVTAAHCLMDKFPGRQGHFRATIHYFDPETGRRPISDTDEVMIGYYKETYNTSADTDKESDIGLIFRGGAGSTPTPKNWKDVGTEDYLRLSLGNCDQIWRSDFFGQGVDGFSDKAVTGTLRTTPIILDDCHRHYFKHLSGDAQVCGGDSGGPYVVTLPSGRRAISGLLSYSDGSRNCTTWPYGEYAMRMNDDKVSWLESKMGRPCLEDIQDDHRTARCWGSTLSRPAR